MGKTGKIKNITGEELIALLEGGPAGRLVHKGQTIDVPVERVTMYTQAESSWEPADDVARELHQDMLDELAEWLQALEPDAPVEEPGGNAGREVWAKYVVAAGLATEDDLVDNEDKPLGRDQIRDTYSKKGD
ncbi:hypothetical protein ACFP8W_06950 [Nocardioides hankookensis]|uniref:Uncharacterized protein n=1 Tax=Nocardioides hankookensis TaxID=443157 RepID=A0ABW1LRH8_9ACTN